MILYERNNVVVRTAEIADVDRMKDHLRPQEVAEVWASHHFTPEEALLFSLRSASEALVLCLDGEPVAMFGICPDSFLDKKACVWLLTTNDVTKMWMRFLKISRAIIRYFRRNHFLYNWIDCRNEQAIKWVRWCGAQVCEPERFGLDGLPFRYFVFGGQ